ncbi:MAG TPA: PEP/pyruvate-binding domain-containing protein [Solirubrobacteraceae bacterium]|nr:PEP/pyruvate-binding domain-containing protein [Solirubrobacteraceae bacterium]
MNGVLALSEAGDESLFGGKAARLARAAAAGLRVPPGVAVPWPLAAALADGDEQARATLAAANLPAGPLAVRSSGVGEDSDAASFAGQHLTLLGVGRPDLPDAVTRVWRSALEERALAYRERLGMAGIPRSGVVIQEMVDATVAGVLFRPHPVTGADEIVIEAAWGLGEAVVSGFVTPDRFRLSPAGNVLAREPGFKDLEVALVPEGGTVRRGITGDRVRALCLDERALRALQRLAAACHTVFAGPQDLEWALAGDRLWLLQHRAAA